MDCMLFFAQRLNELLFHHTTDTYRVPALSLIGLAKEFCNVYKDSQKGIINSKNLKHIIDEFDYRLQKDPVAKNILTKEYVERFNKNNGSWDIKTQYENINYIGRKLSNLAYYNEIVQKLKKLINENKQKKAIDELTVMWVREAIDYGYNENFIYKTLHRMFFHDQVESLETLERFFGEFNFKDRMFDVYIGFSKDMSALKSLFEKIYIPNSKILVLKPQDVPNGIKTKQQQTILKFETIKALDMYSAYETANDISSCVVDSYGFFRHNRSTVKTYGQVMCEDKAVVSIKPKHLLKHRVSSLSLLDAEKNADLLLSTLFSNRQNQKDVRKIIKIHNGAIKSENINDSLLSLWSLLESLFDNDFSSNHSATESTSEENIQKENLRSKSINVIEFLIPFLKSTYVSKLVQTFIEDIIHWDKEFYDTHIVNNGFGENNLEHCFAFLTFKSMQNARDELYAKAETYPLLKNRVMILYELFHNSKELKAAIVAHEQRIRWHCHRIYRARNYIVHDATGNERLNYELLLNLHSYIDTAVSKIVELIQSSPYNDIISDIISEHKLEVSIFDEKLELQDKEDIGETNALKYLYYDYKR